MINYIIGLFSNDIECRIDPRVFHFRMGERTLDVRTYLYTSTDNPPRILSVGAEFDGSHLCRKVDLFERNRDSTAESKGDYLDAFLRYSFQVLADRRALVRPRLTFRNSESLQEYLSGYQRAVLTDAAAKAGARAITFQP